MDNSIQSSNNRLVYFDFLRGIAIFFVVGIHTIKCVDFNTISGNFDALIRQIIGCAVPLFLAISGYFLAKKRLISSSDQISFFWSRFKKLYIPTIIYSLPWVFLSIKDGENPIEVILLALVCGMSVYYFIALILQYYALLPLYQKSGKLGLVGSFFISIICAGIICYMIDIRNMDIPLIAYGGLFPVWGIFFALGIFMSTNKFKICYKTLLLLIIISLVLCCLESRFLCSFHDKGLGVKPSAFIYSALVIILLFSDKIKDKYKKTRLNNLFVRVGNDSFAIYLTHMLVFPFVRYFAKKIEIEEMNWYILWLTLFLADWVIVILMKSIIPVRFRKYFALF